MTSISILKKAGTFAEDKDLARDLRINKIIPALDKREFVTLDFTGVEAATQSFIHALISDVLRKFGDQALDHMTFKSCNETIKKVIGIVVDYMQESTDNDSETA